MGELATCRRALLADIELEIQSNYFLRNPDLVSGVLTTQIRVEIAFMQPGLSFSQPSHGLTVWRAFLSLLSFARAFFSLRGLALHAVILRENE